MKYFYSIIFLLFINCNLNNVQELHGISNLKNKLNNLKLNSSNQNDVITIIGEPVIKDPFDKNVWSYYEVKIKTNFLGNKKIVQNDVVLLKFNSYGVLNYLKIYDINNMNKIQFDENITSSNAINKDFLTDILSSSKKRWDMTRERLKSKSQ